MAKRTKVRRSVKSPAKRARRAPAAPLGPLSLEEARAAVRARRPLRAARTRSKTRVSHAQVGLAKVDLRESQEDEEQRRIDEYTATIKLMKERGVRGLVPTPTPTPGATSVPRRATRAGTPLQVFAEGDSWFDYPVPLFGGGLITRLERQIGVPILNLAKAGDETRFMLGVKQRGTIIKHLAKGCPAGGPWDAMLFSGGGNDIVDNPMALWILEFDAGIAPERHVHPARFDAALSLVRFAYEDLIALRDAVSPTTHLIFHAYDFAIPDGRGICHYGPWLSPTFKLRRFPTQAAAFEVVKEMLRRFAATLSAIAGAHDRVTLVNTQGTLPPTRRSWHNELHPSSDGFIQFAGLFRAQLKQLFPGRVL